MPNAAGWDSNHNQKLWVRADAHAADGQPDDRRAREAHRPTSIPFPRNAITAGWFIDQQQRQQGDRRHEGRHRAARAGRGALQPARAVVRASTTSPPRPGGRRTPTQTGYARHHDAPAGRPRVVAREGQGARHLLRVGLPQLARPGELIFVESGNCRYTGGGSGEHPRSAPGRLHRRRTARHVRRQHDLLRPRLRGEPAAVAPDTVINILKNVADRRLDRGRRRRRRDVRVERRQRRLRRRASSRTSRPSPGRAACRASGANCPLPDAWTDDLGAAGASQRGTRGAPMGTKALLAHPRARMP